MLQLIRLLILITFALPLAVLGMTVRRTGRNTVRRRRINHSYRRPMHRRVSI